MQWLLMILFSSLSFAAGSQSFERILDASGQCHPNISCLYFDSMNRLWIGTSGGGICMYDGRSMAITRGRSDSGTGYFISSVTETGDSRIWVLSEFGVSNFDGHAWQLDTMSQLGPDASLFSYQGKLRLWTGRSLLDFVGGKENNRWKLSTLSSPGTDLVFPAGDGAFIRIKGSRATLVGPNGRETEYRLPAGMMPDRITGGSSYHTSLYLTSADKGIISCADGNCTIVPGSRRGSLVGSMRDADGSIWFYNTEGELYVLKAGEVIRKDSPGGAIRDLSPDQDGNLWFGMDNGDIQRYLSEPFRLVNQPGNYKSGIRRLYLDGQDQVWVVDEEGKAWHFSGTSPAPKPVAAQPAKGGFSDLTRLDARRYLLLSSAGDIQVLDREAGGGEVILHLDSTRRWLQLERDQQRNMWLLSDRDLYKAGYEIRTGFPFLQVTVNACGWTGSNAIQGIHVDRRNRVWWHTRDEIGWHQNGRFYLLDTPGFFGGVTCWTEDESGLLWVGTSGAGLYAVELYQGNPEMKIIRNQTGQSWPVMKNLVIEQDQLFLTTMERVYQYQIDRAGGMIGGGKLVGDIGGIQNLEFIPGTMQIDRFSRVFIGTNQGVFWLSLTSGTESSGATPPKAFIRRIDLDFEDLYETAYADKLGPWNRQLAEIRFRPGENDFRFVFAAANYFRNGSTLFRWRLKGSDSGWSPPAVQDEVFFPDLAPGQYRFEVQACLAQGSCSDDAAAFAFRILPPWYRRWWFYGSIAVLGAILLGTGIALRNRRMHRELIREREKMRLENKALDLERKALQLQMNPHFLFNAMNTIQSEINEDSLQEAKLHLAKFSKLMRQVLESSRKETTSLEEEIELLDHYIAIAALSRGMEVGFEINLAEGIEPDLVEIPTMMLQPFIENAIQHGFKGLDEGTICIGVSFKGKNLLIEITDDGHGFDGREGVREGSVALHVIRERLGMMKRPGKVEIRPLHPDAKSRKGTIVILKLPLE